MHQSDPTTSKKDIFSTALNLVPEIQAIIEKNGQTAEKEQQVATLLESRLFEPAQSDAEIYLAALIKAYVHLLLAGDHLPENLAENLQEFIQGEFEVKATPTEKIFSRQQVKNINDHLHESHKQWTRVTAEEEAVYQNTKHVSIVGLEDGNHLGMWKIIEKELALNFEDQDLARRLAASTARLFLPFQSSADHGYHKHHRQFFRETLNIFKDSLQAHQVNPFAQAKILEFAANSHALTQENFPLIDLFKQYRDYTPCGDFIIDSKDKNYITLQKPGKFFEPMNITPEAEKFDYVIASNIFFRGAVSDTHGNNRGYDLDLDLLPHLASCLKDQGKLVVCNTALDGIEMDQRGVEYGLACDEPLSFMFNANQYLVKDSGISVLKRDYQLRPPIAYTAEEFKYDCEEADKRHIWDAKEDPQEARRIEMLGKPQLFIDRLQENRERKPDMSGWNIDL